MRARTISILAIAILGAASGSAGAGDTGALEPYAVKAREAVKAMGGALQSKLKEAIAAGGPVSAVAVCNTLAPQITAEKSAAAGMSIKRTALRVRNPANAPDELEKRILEDFAAQFAAGKDPATVEHIEEVEAGGRTQVRYFKAIPTAKEPCLACHGSAVSGELMDVIGKLYPQDAATGFSAGDLRGAFSVTMEKMPQQ